MSRPLPATVRRFIAFRVLFNARFYYPVIAILFLDLGLSMEQYAALNAVWAAAIVLCEVPSGAMADRFGRKRLVVFAATLMVAEMLLLLFAPADAGPVLIVCVLLNRILSGVAEASASGADEALAYDTLAAEGRAEEWPAVLGRLMRWQALGFVCSSMLGAVAYDPRLLNRIAAATGLSAGFTSPQTLRLPVALTLVTALAALAMALRMHEAPRQRPAHDPTPDGTWALMAKAARWILDHRFFLVLILSAVCFDSFIRLFLTVASSYYRLIAVPEAAYGLIGSGFALLGFAVPPVAGWLVRQRSPAANLALIALLALVGLAGLGVVWRGWGLLFVLPLAIAFYFQSFLLSHHLNRGVDSSMRATVLSFKGLAMNVAYGAAGLAFSALVAFEQHRQPAAGPDAAFAHALGWLAPLFVAALLPLAMQWPRLREPASVA